MTEKLKSAIGLICLDSLFPKPIGHVRNPETFDFPVLTRLLQGVTVKKILCDESSKLADIFIEAACDLEHQGVRAITGSCGFMAQFQKEIARAVNIPVFMSSLLQIPLVYSMLNTKNKIGVLTASKQSLSERHLRAVAAEDLPVIIEGLEDQKQFRKVIIDGKHNELDFKIFENEIFSVTENMLSENDNIGALLLECTDLTYFSRSLRIRFNLPVFDIITLTKMVQNACAL